MKSSELMIGDYISVAPSMLPIKIAAVHNKKVAYHACIHKLEWVRESLLRPIPLTIEILEKNNIYEGWSEPFKGYNLMVLTNGHYSIEDHCLIEFKYVHELQHALRLCNISKEIII